MPGQAKPFKPFQAAASSSTSSICEQVPLLQKRDAKAMPRFSNLAPTLVTLFVILVIFCMPGLPGEGVSFLVGNRWFPPVHPTCSPDFGVGAPDMRWCRTRPGFHIACAHNDVFCDSICRWGYWEHASTKSLGFPSTPTGDVVDVGAHMGWYSLLFAQSGYTVHAYEALTSNVQMLNASICANPQMRSLLNVHSVTLAAAPVESCKVLSSRASASNGTVCCPEDQCPFEKNPSFEVREVKKTSTLDAELDQLTEPIAFLKLDVEGYECQVLKGALQTFKRLAPQYVKADISDGDDSQCGAAEYLSLLRSLGYTASFAENEAGFLASRYDTASSMGLALADTTEILAVRVKK